MVEDTRDELRELFVLSCAVDGKSVGGYRCVDYIFAKKGQREFWITKITNSASVRIRTLWCSEVDDVSIGLEHVHLLNCLNGLHVQLLKCGLELLVVDARAFRLALNFPSWGSLPAGASCQNLSYYGNYQRVCMGSRS